MIKEWCVFKKPVGVTLEEFLNNLERIGYNIFSILSDKGYEIVTWRMKDVGISFSARASLKDNITNIEDNGYIVNKIKQGDGNFIIEAYKKDDYNGKCFQFNLLEDKVKEGMIHRG